MNFESLCNLLFKVSIWACICLDDTSGSLDLECCWYLTSLRNLLTWGGVMLTFCNHWACHTMFHLFRHWYDGDFGFLVKQFIFLPIDN